MIEGGSHTTRSEGPVRPRLSKLKMVFTDRRVTATIQLAWGPRDVIEGGTHTTRSVGPAHPRLSNEP